MHKCICFLQHKLINTKDTNRSRPLSLLSSATTLTATTCAHCSDSCFECCRLTFKTNRCLGLRFFWGAAKSLRQTLSNTHMYLPSKGTQSWLPPPLSLQRPLSQHDCPSRGQGPAEYAWASSPARQVWTIDCASSVWYAWCPRQHRTPPALIRLLCLRRGAYSMLLDAAGLEA